MSKNIFMDRYELVEHIGQGGMADVYIAYDNLLKRNVAIKLLKGELDKDHISLLRFKQEALASSKLYHPNIIETYDVGVSDNRPFIVMEYVKGHTLKQIIEQRGPLVIKESVSIMKQLTGGIMHAHKNGVIHRDIKPQNIIVKDDGTLKILDFGIALVCDSLDLTQQDSVVGSVHYIAPEVCMGEMASVQSDIYSLGIVLYELVTGKVPFNGEKVVNVALKHIHEEIPDPCLINPDVPQSIVNIIRKATNKDLSKRYMSCQELLYDLENYQNEHAKNPIKSSAIKVSSKANKANKITKINKKNKNKGNMPYIIIGILCSISAILLMGFIFFFSDSNKSKIVPMIDVVGMTYSQAKDELENLGLFIDNNIERVMTEDVEKGLIISSNPSANEEIEKGTLIKLVISDGIYSVMDNYIGQNIDDVKSLLNRKYPNINVIIESVESSEIKGSILTQELIEPNAKFDKNKKLDIKFTYSKYDSFVIPQDLIGMDVIEAKEKLESMGAQVLLSVLDTSTMSKDEKDRLEYGVVYKLSPANGVSYTQKDGSFITIYYY